MFDMAPMGLVFLSAGIIYMVVVGFRLLPDRGQEKDLRQKFSMRDYLTEMEIPAGSDLAGKRIMDAGIFSELEMDILDLRREGQLPCSFGRFFAPGRRCAEGQM